MKKIIRDFSTALTFLTILPFPTPKTSEESSLAKSMIFFPLIGFLIGVIALTAAHFLEPIFSSRFAYLMMVLIPILLNGGLHIDGFADFVDGFLGGEDKAGILRIMKDSAIGAWAVVAVVFLILAKWELIVLLPLRAGAFLFALTASRWAQVLLSFFQAYAGAAPGLGTSVARKVQAREMVGATLTTFAAAIFLLGLNGVVIMAALAIFVFLIGRYFQSRIGGITGDLIGATSEITELLVFMLAICMARISS